MARLLDLNRCPAALISCSWTNRRVAGRCFAATKHAAVDDKRGVILDVEVRTGEINEGNIIEAQADAVMAITGIGIETITADAGYAYGKVYGALERRGIDPLIPAKAEPVRCRVPTRRFHYDAKRDIAKCPKGRILRPGRRLQYGRFFYSEAKDCSRCPMKGACLSKGRANKVIACHFRRRGHQRTILVTRAGADDARARGEPGCFC